MTTADRDCGPAAWTAEDQRWYADLVAQCMQPNQSRAAVNVPTVLRQLEAMPFNQCLKMRGKRSLDGRTGRAWEAWDPPRLG